LQVREYKLPVGHPHIALSLHSFGRLCARQRQHADAEEYYKRALAIREAALPMEHPHRAKLLEHYAELLVEMGRTADATDYTAKANAAREKHVADEASEV